MMAWMKKIVPDIVFLFLCLPSLVAAHETDPEEWIPVNVITVTVSAVVVMVMIVALIQCGGCVGMEVSSESHPATGAHKGQNYPSSVITDANTQVLMSSHTLPGDDPYQPGNGGQSLPYALNPAVPSAPGFTGYQTSPTQPAPGWGQPGGGSAQGYQSPGPGAHRPAMSSEPPPPSYNDSIRGSDALW